MTLSVQSSTTTRLQDAAWFPAPLSFAQETIRFRFLDRSDRSDVKKLIRLFMRQYGMSYPHAEVYDAEFWFTGERAEDPKRDSVFFSCIADKGDNFVAHLGFRCDVVDKSVELIFPVLDPDYRHLLKEIAQAFWDAMTGLATQYRWFKVHYFNIASHTAQVIAAECFGSHEMALVPNELSPQGRPKVASKSVTGSTPLLLMYSLLNAKQSPSLDLYPPENHFEAVRDLYAPLGLPRMFRAGNVWIGSTRSGSRGPRPTPELSSMSQILDPHFHDMFGVTWVTLEPSRVTNTAFAMDYLEWLSNSLDKQRRKLCVRVALSDIHCPRFCHMLEKTGYWFCGIMPLVEGRDYLLFGKFDVQSLLKLELYTPRAQALRNYMVCYYGKEESQNNGEGSIS